jgi:hypothetical protein
MSFPSWNMFGFLAFYIGRSWLKSFEYRAETVTAMNPGEGGVRS